ncbi:hypothetical protein JOM56_013487, partial [Amanita muscaria]
RSVKFENLPENVVPLTRNTNQTNCSLPDDTSIRISRSQVEVLPNFAMTDYASQGKTRRFNIVDLNNSRSHQAYYTALSPSASATGTLILQGFNCKKITGGASGALRQEFRALELLDHITCLRYRGKLPACVAGNIRKELIAGFRAWKGEHFIPQGVHKSIRWSKSDPIQKLGRPQPADDSVSIELGNSVNLLDELQCKDTQRCRKRRYKADEEVHPEYSQQIKKIKTSSSGIKDSVVPENSTARQVNIPLGLRWKENSCAYDATLTILYNAWQEDPTVMTDHFAAMSLDTMFKLSDGFLKVLNGLADFNDVRDALRNELAARWPLEFCWGRQIPIDMLLDRLLKPCNNS